MKKLIVLMTLAALAAPASAQSVNVNFGDGPTPSPTYAAAGAAGTWNTVSGIAGKTFSLVTTDGAPSDITVSQSPTTTLLATSDGSVSGDDAALLNSGLVTHGAETCLTFNGFRPGRYEVLIYAWLPNQPTVKSRTRQDQAPATVDVGGAWPGAHAEGVTYARYVVDVGSDGRLPAHSGLVPGAPAAALNGIQIRPLADTSPDAGPAGVVDAGPSEGQGDGGNQPDAHSPGAGGQPGAGGPDAGGQGSAQGTPAPSGGCNVGGGPASGTGAAWLVILVLAFLLRDRGASRLRRELGSRNG